MVFRKEITTNKPIARARLYATAMGIYEAELNGQKLGEQYFAPASRATSPICSIRHTM